MMRDRWNEIGVMRWMSLEDVKREVREVTVQEQLGGLRVECVGGGIIYHVLGTSSAPASNILLAHHQAYCRCIRG